jgi:hypothetical protein
MGDETEQPRQRAPGLPDGPPAAGPDPAADPTSEAHAAPPASEPAIPSPDRPRRRAMPLEDGIDWRHAARLLRGKSPADLRQLVDDAGGIALADDRDEVAERDIIDAIRRDGQIEPEDTLDLAAPHRIATHEAGHVAVCVALRGARWVYAVRLGPQGGSTAYGDETVPVTGRPDDETRDSLAVNFGRIAAEMAVSEGTSGGSSDVSSATQTALGRSSDPSTTATSATTWRVWSRPRAASRLGRPAPTTTDRHSA